ncbi:MAG: YihY family inner membrane protein, partial [Burkholderiaceae bacterium]
MLTQGLSFAQGFSLEQVRDLCRFAVRRLNEERLPQTAASLTFTTLLALVPMLTIALAIFTGFPLFDTVKKSLEAYFIQNLMPKSIANVILSNLNQFAAKATRLSAIGAVLLIVTAVSMVAMVDKTFNQIWRVRTRRALSQRVVIYWAAITLGPLLVGVSITVTSYLFTATKSVVGELPLVGTMFFTSTSLFLTTAAFTLLYLVVPNKRIEWQDALCGGAIAAIAFEITKRLFASFVSHFPNYTMVYGALAAVPVFLVWVYLGWLIILSGAVIAAALPAVRSGHWWHASSRGSEFFDAMAVLEVLHGARFAERENALDFGTIAEHARLGPEECENVLQKLLARGWIARIRSEGNDRVPYLAPL